MDNMPIGAFIYSGVDPKGCLLHGDDALILSSHADFPPFDAVGSCLRQHMERSSLCCLKEIICESSHEMIEGMIRTGFARMEESQ